MAHRPNASPTDIRTVVASSNPSNDRVTTTCSHASRASSTTDYYEWEDDALDLPVPQKAESLTFTAHEPVSHGPSHELFSFKVGYNLSQFEFTSADGTRTISYHDAFCDPASAGGDFSRVRVGIHRDSRKRMALKLLQSDFASFDVCSEVDILIRIRQRVDSVFHSGIRRLADQGALHVLRVYGVGMTTREETAALRTGLCSDPYMRYAFIVSEPLARTLADVINSCAPDHVFPLEFLLRFAHQLALALAFLAQHFILVSEARE